MNDPGPRQWLSPTEVAAELALSLSTVRLMIRDGRLPARRLRGSRLIRIARENLNALLDEPVLARLRLARAKTAGL